MSIFEIMSNPAVGNLFILLAAIIGVGGSYYLYQLRQREERRRLRKALLAEITSMEKSVQGLGQHNGEFVDLNKDIFSTLVYENNTDRLGLLTDKEVEMVVIFYSFIVNVRRDIEREEGEALGHVDVGEIRGIRKARLQSLHSTLIETVEILEDNLDKETDLAELATDDDV